MAQIEMRPQDILVALAIVSAKGNLEQLSGKNLAGKLSLSQAEVSNVLTRLSFSGLVRITGKVKEVRLLALIDFLAYGIRYIYPPVFGKITIGVPTAASAEPFASRIIGAETIVWPYMDGKARGTGLQPIYPSVPQVALQDPEMHLLLAATDIFRAGSAREREIAREIILDYSKPHAGL